MCGNRVEELETRVQELEASVEGLTDELVECKVRIRELENTVDEQSGFGSDEAAPQPQSAGESAASGDAETADATAADDGSDIIVPEVGTSNTEGPEGTDNTTVDHDDESETESEEDSGSDIIVA